MYILRLQTSIVWFLSLFSEGPMCMHQNFKLLCCAAYILNLIVSICLSCWPNLWCWGYFQPNSVASEKIRLSRISAENMVQPAEFFEKSGWGVYEGGIDDFQTWTYGIDGETKLSKSSDLVNKCSNFMSINRSLTVLSSASVVLDLVDMSCQVDERLLQQLSSYCGRWSTGAAISWMILSHRRHLSPQLCHFVGNAADPLLIIVNVTARVCQWPTI